MAGIKIKVVDNTQVFIKAKDEATQTILNEIGETAVGYAQATVPKRTGDLMRSIGYDIDRVAVRIYATMPYASYVEQGTSKMHARPYLRPAVLDHTSEYHDMAESIYRSGGNPNKQFRIVRTDSSEE